MAYISGCDAQLILEKFLHKKKLWSVFFFDYDGDEYDQLSCVFWTDPMARRNFACFGDAISFDATYQTNKYDLVFVSFAGIDNHKKSVTFAAGLISKENVESYVWLLENFKQAMDHEPTYTIADQDQAMRTVVAKVSNSSWHRFYMWHIMTKVGNKVGSVLPKDQSFRQALNDVVWDETSTIEEFEAKWNSVIELYGLCEHMWFRQMYDMRAFWIPAFFRDLHMGGVVDTQRHKQAKLDAVCECHLSAVNTPLAIERVQVEDNTNNVYIVVYYSSETTVDFSCRMFQRVGLLCRHIFPVFKDARLDYIPPCYLVSRWTRDAYKRPIYDIDGVYDDAAAGDSSDLVIELAHVLKELKLSFVNADSSLGTSVGKYSVIHAFGGVLTSADIVVHPLTVAKNKVSRKRIKLPKELVVEKTS